MLQRARQATRPARRAIRHLFRLARGPQAQILAELRELRAQVRSIENRQSVYLGNQVALTRMANGQLIFADTRGADLGAHLMMGGEWETPYVNLFRALIRPGDTILDLGVNHGVYSLVAADAAGPAGRVIGFEAQAQMARLATMSCSINGFADRVQIHNLAVSNEKAMVTIYVREMNPAGSSLHADRAGRDTGTEVEAVVLDDFLPDDLVANVIKCDIDGWDGCALGGAKKIIARSPDVKLVLEWYPTGLNKSPMGAQEVADMVSGMGFNVWTIDDRGAIAPASWSDLLATRIKVQNILLAKPGFRLSKTW